MSAAYGIMEPGVHKTGRCAAVDDIDEASAHRKGMKGQCSKSVLLDGRLLERRGGRPPRRSVRQSATAALNTSGTPKATRYIEPLITSLMPNASEGWRWNSHRRSSPPPAGQKKSSSE